MRLFTIIYLLVAFLLQAPLVYGHSEVASLHVHASSYANGTPDNYSYETSIFQLCESYNLATGVCEGDIYNVETDTVWAQTFSIHAGSFEIVPESCLIWAAGITFDVTLSD